VRSGLSLQAGQWAAAQGAFLLFLTNFLSILLAGGGVLALLGLNRAAMNEIKGSARRNAFLPIFIAVLLVTVPLGVTSQRIAEEAHTEGVSKAITEQWVANAEYEVQGLNAT
jgi:uncharacterized membrane protein